MVVAALPSLTFEEYLAYDDGEGNRYELVDGTLALRNPPTVLHFLIAKFVEQALDREIKRLGQPWLLQARILRERF